MSPKLFLFAFLQVIFLFTSSAQSKLDSNLFKKLAQMEVSDQIAASPHKQGQNGWDRARWVNYKDSIFRANTEQAKDILNRYGYPGFDRVGKTGELNFWLIVQHSDFDPEFQMEVLEALEIEYKRGNASSRHFGLLTDRVNLNNGEAQVYGTQVSYNSDGQAFSRHLSDSTKVDKMRAEVGLEPLKHYLNSMTKMHFEMNKAYYEKRGILVPKLY